MKQHFSFTFRLKNNKAADASDIASQITGNDFHVQDCAINSSEFSVHFERLGCHSVELLNNAKNQVLSAVPDAELIAMDMDDQVPMAGIVHEITNIVIQACDVFKNSELADVWLSQPQGSLNGEVPKSLMADATGRCKVAKALTEVSEAS